VRNRFGRIAAISVAVFAGAAGVAFATGLGSATTQSVINGCMQKNNGQLRIADSCHPDEQTISWNAAGAKGDPGPAGLQGPPGPAGPAGKDGADGKNGVDGTNGVDGKDGVAGKDGTNGVSVTSNALGKGDPNCPNGGAAFTAVDGTTFACNGKDGVDGTNGNGPAAYTAHLATPGGTTSFDIPNVGTLTNVVQQPFDGFCVPYLQNTSGDVEGSGEIVIQPNATQVGLSYSTMPNAQRKQTLWDIQYTGPDQLPHTAHIRILGSVQKSTNGQPIGCEAYVRVTED
jgi:hypothetical protein